MAWGDSTERETAFMDDNKQIIELISKCEEPDKLRVWIKNAQTKGAKDVADAAFRQLIAVMPSEKSGTVEFDFWRTIHAFEHTLSEERGRTTRLSRTRQKVTRVGEVKTLKDWALSNKQTDGFDMLLERGMPELTGEAIVLRHPDKFDSDVIDAAEKGCVMPELI